MVMRMEDILLETKKASERHRSTIRQIDNFKYPKGVQLAVNFTVDFDAMLLRRVYNEPVMWKTQGEFGGRVGIWRLLDFADKHGVKLTVFTPGRIAELYPESLKAIVKRGHELANHTWEHQIPKDSELELDHLRKTTMAFERLGKRPVGTRSAHKLSFLRSEGYIYTSSEIPLEMPHYVVYNEGKNSMLNLPCPIPLLDDAAYFNYRWILSPPEGQRITDPSKVYEIWVKAFRQLYKRGLYMNICIHPFVSGRALRIAMLDRLITEMKRMPGVWLPTCEELARYCYKNFPPEIPY